MDNKKKKNLKEQQQEQEPQVYADNISIECSRLQAQIKQTNYRWTNDLHKGIRVSKGDSIEISHGFLQANGAGDGITSIQFDNKFLEKKVYNNFYTHSTREWDLTYTKDIYDNKTSLLINFHKYNDGLNCIQIPSTTFEKNWLDNVDTVNVESTQLTHLMVPIQTSTYWSSGGNFVKNDILEYHKNYFDNSKFTIVARDKTKDYSNINNSAWWQFYEVLDFIDIEVDKGFNNCNNVAEQITQQFNEIVNEYELTDFRPRQHLSGTPNNFSLTAPTLSYSDYPTDPKIKETNMLKAFTCGTRFTLCENVYKAFYNGTFGDDYYFQNFDYIGVKYINFFIEGRKVGNEGDTQVFPQFAQTISAPITEQWVRFKWNWDKIEQFFKWIDTQQREEGLLTRIGYNKIDERFLHIKPKDDFNHSTIGGDKWSELSYIVKLHINQSYYGVNTDATFDRPHLGIFVKDTDEYFYMKISTFSTIQYPITAFNRTIGYDRALSAYGNQSIMLFNGLGIHQDMAHTVPLTQSHPVNNQITHNTITYDTDVAINKIYLGADQPILNYNADENKFELSNLCFFRKAVNTPYANNPIGTSGYDTYNSLNPNAGLNQYYINPLHHPIIYQPAVRPLYSTQHNAAQFYNVERFKVFDCISGVGIVDFSFIDNTFRDLFNVLGYRALKNSYTNKTDTAGNYLQLKRNSFNSFSYPYTTNAEIESEDLVQYGGSIWGASYFSPIPSVYQTTDMFNSGYTQIIINANSTTITADKIASKTNHSFYIVRSSIIPQILYYGNRDDSCGNPINVFSIVSKENRLDDYLFLSSSGDMSYTFKDNYIINTIETTIENNDGTPAVLDENNTIIYKIRKKVIDTIDII